MAQNEFAPVTPGEMLKDEFLAEYDLSQNQLAKAVGISPDRIAEIVNTGRRLGGGSAGTGRTQPRRGRTSVRAGIRRRNSTHLVAGCGKPVGEIADEA